MPEVLKQKAYILGTHGPDYPGKQAVLEFTVRKVEEQGFEITNNPFAPDLGIENANFVLGPIKGPRFDDAEIIGISHIQRLPVLAYGRLEDLESDFLDYFQGPGRAINAFIASMRPEVLSDPVDIFFENLPYYQAGIDLNAPPVVHRDNLTIDPVKRRVTVDGRRLSIIPRDFQLLFELIGHPGEIIKNNDLLAKVWEGASFDPVVVRVAIGRLREGLGPNSKIKTAHGVGGYYWDTEIKQTKLTSVTNLTLVDKSA